MDPLHAPPNVPPLSSSPTSALALALRHLALTAKPVTLTLASVLLVALPTVLPEPLVFLELVNAKPALRVAPLASSLKPDNSSVEVVLPITSCCPSENAQLLLSVDLQLICLAPSVSVCIFLDSQFMLSTLVNSIFLTFIFSLS